MILTSLGLIFLVGAVMCLVGKAKGSKLLFYLGVCLIVVAFFDLAFLTALFIKFALLYLGFFVLVILVLWLVFHLSKKQG